MMKERIGRPLNRMTLLLTVLLVMIVANPYFSDLPLILGGLTAVGILAAVQAVGGRGRALLIAVLLGAPTFIFFVAGGVATLPQGILLAGLLLSLAFFFFVAVVLFRHIYNASEVTPDVLLAAVCIYMLLCFGWASLYAVVEVLQPGSFSIHVSGDVGLYHFIYYSFVTMTTLGYGDITPQTAPGQSLAILQALMGVFYMGILMARLIGVFVSERRTEG